MCLIKNILFLPVKKQKQWDNNAYPIHGMLLWKLARKFTFVMSDVKSSTIDTFRFKFASAE